MQSEDPHEKELSELEQEIKELESQDKKDASESQSTEARPSKGNSVPVTNIDKNRTQVEEISEEEYYKEYILGSDIPEGYQ